MTQKELREKVELLIGEEFLEPVHKGLYGYTQSQIAMKKLMQLFQTYQAQDRERIARALEKRIGLRRRQAQAHLKVFEDGHFKYWEARADGLNEALQDFVKAKSIVQGTEEEGDK